MITREYIKNTKICSKCRFELELSKDFFHVDRSDKTGFRSDCKKCHMKSKEPRKTERKKGVRKSSAEYNRRFRASLSPAKRKIANRKKYEKVKDKIEFKLLRNARKRLREALKGKYKKNEKTRVLIGCEIEFLKKHLEFQFRDGMNWENYGQWHIDHIKPCASFNFSEPEQQRICFHYTNLQPLWALDNIKKGDKLI